MSEPTNLAYLTSDLPGIGGTIKNTPEDFRVTELPLYEPSGEGTHIYFGLGKRGIPTHAAIDRVAGALGVRSAAFAAAGLKDAQAVTEQAISVEHLTDSQIETLGSFSTDAAWVTWVSRHTNKLKIGHLAGNRFCVRIRDVEVNALGAAEAIAEVLQRRGVPNYFGNQRFGDRGDNWALGQAIIAGRLDDFVATLLGHPLATDAPALRVAREHFDAGRYPEALAAWPGRYRNERSALAAWIRTDGVAKATFGAVDKFLKRFCTSAFQSLLFNRIVHERISEIDTVVEGDLAKKSDSGGVFLVENLAIDAPRAAAFEISPTAPLFGYRVRLAEGRPGTIEHATLKRFELTCDDWRRRGAFKIKGTRRAMRFHPQQLSLASGDDDRGPYIEVQFAAPPGSYATVLLREIMKNDTIPMPGFS